MARHLLVLAMLLLSAAPVPVAATRPQLQDSGLSLGPGETGLDLDAVPAFLRPILEARLAQATGEEREALAERLRAVIAQSRPPRSLALSRQLDEGSEDEKEAAARELIALVEGGGDPGALKYLDLIVILPPKQDMTLAAKAAELVLERSQTSSSILTVLKHSQRLPARVHDEAVDKLIDLGDVTTLEQVIRLAGVDAERRRRVARVLLESPRGAGGFLLSYLANQSDLGPQLREESVIKLVASLHEDAPNPSAGDCWPVGVLLDTGLPFLENRSSDRLAQSLLDHERCGYLLHAILGAHGVSPGIVEEAAQRVVKAGDNAYGLALVLRRLGASEGYQDLTADAVKALTAMAAAPSTKSVGTVAWALEEAWGANAVSETAKREAAEAIVGLGRGLPDLSKGSYSPDVHNVLEALGAVALKLSPSPAQQPTTGEDVPLQAFELLAELAGKIPESHRFRVASIMKAVFDALPKHAKALRAEAERIIDEYGSGTLKNLHAIQMLSDALRENEALREQKRKRDELAWAQANKTAI